MFNAVENVRLICQSRGIAISQLEKDCGFSNGYLNPKKVSKIPYDRAVKIAEHLHLSVDYILTGQEQPLVNNERLSEDDIKNGFFEAAFFEGGKDLTNEEKNALWEDAKSYMRFKITEKKKAGNGKDNGFI